MNDTARPAAPDVYARLGVRRRINAAGTLTRLGGALMAPEILAAMAEAAKGTVDMGELQSAASRAIAPATGAAAGIVPTGPSAAPPLRPAACIPPPDVAQPAATPPAPALARPRTHRSQYAHALAAAGARLVDLGHNDRGTGAGVRGLEAWEIEAAIGPQTAAFAFAATPASVAELSVVVAVCRPRGIPVIVDA